MNDVNVWLEHARANERYMNGRAAAPISHVFPFTPDPDQTIFVRENVF